MNATQWQREWSRMLARSWSPHQWYLDEKELDDRDTADGVQQGEERIMWVYRSIAKRAESSNTTSGLGGSIQTVYAVGYYDPKGEWHLDGEYVSPEQAAQRVNYLNGGALTNPSG